MFAMARSSYEINAGLNLTPVLNRRLLKNLAKEIDAPGGLLFKDLRYIRIYTYLFYHDFCSILLYIRKKCTEDCIGWNEYAAIRWKQ